MDYWEWPQWFMIGLWVVGFVLAAIRDYNNRTAPVGVSAHIAGLLIVAFVLYKGGFF